jgi:hypothetical protein
VSERDIIQETVDACCKRQGFVKKSGSWYLYGEDLITVVNLQRSQYGPAYYINIGFWLVTLGSEKFPKINKCHLYTRVESAFPEYEDTIYSLLDLTSGLGDDKRREEFEKIFCSNVIPTLVSVNSVSGLRSSLGRRITEFALKTPTVLPFIA